MNGQPNTLWNTVQGTFTSSDGTADYHTTLKLTNSHLEGTTHAPTRQLFPIWTATKAE